jgi:carbon storage regulator
MAKGLVLTRRQGQSIRIGDDILVTVEELKGGQVRIGVTAPKDIQVDRAEAENRVPIRLDRGTKLVQTAEGKYRPAKDGEPHDAELIG